jgi:hypothetical protein
MDPSFLNHYLQKDQFPVAFGVFSKGCEKINDTKIFFETIFGGFG